jgi:protein required for attachment to host cells
MIAVSDGEKLRMFRNSGNEQDLVLEELSVATLDTHNKGSGQRHHSSSANPDSRQPSEDSYASATVDLLNKMVLAGQVEKLYVVAPPRTLGEMRKHYHAALKAKLIGELDKEHVNDALDVLRKALLNA